MDEIDECEICGAEIYHEFEIRIGICYNCYEDDDASYGDE